MRFVEGPQGRLRVDDGGEGGLPVLLVHGGAGSLAQWDATLAHLRRHRRAAAFDLRGMGASDPPGNCDYSLGAMADDVHAVAEALGYERFALAGHSYGGGVIAACAARHPERLAALVFVDSYGVPWEPTSAEREEMERGFRPGNYAAFVARWFAPLLDDATAGTRRAVLAGLQTTPREAFIAATNAGMRFDPRAALAGYRGPVFAIGAERLDGPHLAQRALPVRDFRILKGVSHWLMMDRPDEFCRDLDELLAEVG